MGLLVADPLPMRPTRPTKSTLISYSLNKCNEKGLKWGNELQV